MSRSTLFPPRRPRRFAVAIMFGAFGALAACADPSGPARAVSPNAIIIIGGLPVVFNAQLRAVGNPDIKPPGAVVGHLQLKIYESDEAILVNWQAHLANPECEASTSFGGGIYAIQDSEDFPSPEDQALIDLRPVETALGCGDNFREGATGISEELAARLLDDPEDFTAVFFLDGGGVIAGTLQLGGPDTTPTR